MFTTDSFSIILGRIDFIVNVKIMGDRELKNFNTSVFTESRVIIFKRMIAICCSLRGLVSATV